MLEGSESLYEPLSDRAYKIVSHSFRGFSAYELRQVAHDITVDFLYFSKSFKETYNPKKGELLPFFGSYVRKKCRRVNENFSNLLRRTSSEDVETLAMSDDEFEWVDFQNRMDAFHHFLLEYYSEKINLGHLFHVVLRCVLEEGQVVKKVLCKKLGVSLSRLNVALEEMRQRIKELLEGGY